MLEPTAADAIGGSRFSLCGFGIVSNRCSNTSRTTFGVQRAPQFIDVSAKTAKVLGFYDDGLSKVKIEYVGRAQ